MKRIFVIIGLFLSFMIGQAQFEIKGTIENYNQKPVIVRIYENGLPKFLTKLETDKNGNLAYKFPINYEGLVNLELGGGAYQLISDNSDINFSLNIDDSTRKVKFDGGVNKQFSEYNQYKTYLNIRDKTLPVLESFYETDQPFYKAIIEEKQRISSLKPTEITNSSLRYYIDVQNLLDGYTNGEKPKEQIAQESLQHLAKDGMEIENLGFLPQFVTQYLSSSIQGAQSKEDAEKLLKESIDKLLDLVGEDTARGQSILISIINLLQNSNFKDIAEGYKHKAEALTCEVTPQLKEMLQGDKNVQVGKKVPNIVFDRPIKGKKSLYDIKADKKLVLFWGSWCGHCKHEMPFVKEFYESFKKSGGEIFAFAVDLNKEDYLPFINGTDWYNYSDLLKWDSPVVKDFGVNGTPTFILLDKDNKVVKTGSRVSQFVDFSSK